ncbi:MAG: 2-oxoacid:acceptor oxidoreductase subunit alpha [Methanobrevibacter sp.]|jgi:2-oxoglutarate ferredoxin oxidoreductase subunit alpha|nr:2-oxoacid:acceptor oxidoreductase subunit alpha [Candidatus Methanovirga aequatorialis]
MTKELFIQGNEACARGAIEAGCRFFGGYPITPSTEIAEYLSIALPKVSGSFIQMEDEISAIGSVIGASWSGVKSMTATSGPGFSLMQENVGFAMMSETPLVIVDVQRGSPSTGQPTMAGQGDVMQVRWGSHGDYEPIAISPSSVQEFFDFTVRGFNLSEKYRVPVVILADEVIGHMRERILLPDKIETFKRVQPNEDPKDFLPFKNVENGTNPMPAFGDGYNIHVTGLTHNELGYPTTINPKVHSNLVKRLVNKILKNREDIVSCDFKYCDDADVVLIGYGAPVRSIMETVKIGRSNGLKIGYLKINTTWPFPEDEIAKLAKNVDDLMVVEMNLGQMVHELERVARGDANVHLFSEIGGTLPKPKDILNRILDLI